METFYLKKPTLELKDEIIDYINEYAKYNSNTNGTGLLDRILEGDTFEQALERCQNMENNDYAKSVGRCPGKTFLLVRENDDKIVGSINVRWNLNEAMLKFGGHMGYGIRPTERNKGYNKINLYLGLIEAKKIGLDQVMLDCTVDNTASNKTIKALGGKLTRSEIDPSDKELTNVYWINVNESLIKYEHIYEPFISTKEHQKRL